MQTYKFFVVNISMFFSKICNETLSVVVVLLLTSLTPTVNSVITSALTYGSSSSSFRPIPTIPTKLKAVLRNNNGNLPFPENNPKFLKASINTNLPPTFSLANWNNISKLGKQPTKDLASNYNYNTDNLHFENDNILIVYGYTLLLLLHKMQTWLDSDRDLESIEYYLGFNRETTNFINIAMTELISTKRIYKEANNNCIESLFYYSCDIKHMQQNRNTVAQKFKYFIEMFRYPREDILNEDVAELETILKVILDALVDTKIKTPFKVSIESMKMTILSDPSENDIVNSIKNRPVSSGMHRTIQELVKSYATESDGIRVNAYHVSILSILIPDMFGYVYNHFELLYKLQEYEFNENDKNIIKNFSKFMSSFIPIFVNRFFEFKGQLSQELQDVMNSVKLFLDPFETNTDYIQHFNNDGQSILRDPDLFQVYAAEKTIDNYFNKSERNYVIDYMKELMGNAIQKLLVTCTAEPLDQWKTNRFSKILDQKENNDKDSLMTVVIENNNNALDILKIFSEIFIDY